MAKRKIVDAHQHLWKLSAGYNYPWLQDQQTGEGMLGSLAPIIRDYLPADYRADAADYDLVGTVHVEAVPHDAVAETRWLDAIPASDKVAQVVVAHAKLNDPGVEKVIAAHAAFPKVRGIRQIVNWHANPKLTFTGHDLLADEVWLRNFRLLKKYGLAFDLQLYASQMGEAADLARANPDTLLIVNHTGMPLTGDPDSVAQWHAGMKRMAAEPNIAVKLSGLGMVDHRWNAATIRPYILAAIDYFGVDRAMFGSNFPVDRLYSSFATLYRAFEEIVAGFSPAEQSALFHDNALRLYRFQIAAP